MAQLHLKHFTWFQLHHLIIILFLLLLLHGGVDAQSSSMQPVPTYISHHNWEPSFAITIGAIICALLFMGIITIYIRKCAESHITTNNQTNNNPRTTSECSCSCSQGIAKELLNTFPILFYPTIKDLKIGKGSLECAVCLTDFKDYDTLRLLPKCNHVFHPHCIDSWLCSHVTCPVCRANLNQDSCEVAVTVQTQLNTLQRVDESSGTEAEHNNGGGEENEVEQNQVVENEDHGKTDDGVAPKSKLLRSNSTGHSLVEQRKSEERFMLRLPEDVKRYLIVNQDVRVHRSASYNNNNNMVRGVCWSDSEGGSNKGKNLWMLWSRG